MENLSALIETLLLLVTCAWIIYEAIHRLLSGRTHIDVNTWSYIVVISSIVIDVGRSKALYRVARKYNSQALEADGLHFATDIWSSVVVLLGLVCASFGFFFADSIAALGVSIIVLSVSFRLGRRAIDVLLDRAPDGTNVKVTRVLNSIHEIKYFHGLKIRSSGAHTFIKVNIHLNPDLSLNSAHGICDRLEQAIRLEIPRCEVYIHAEPQEKTHLLHDKRERISISVTES